MSDYTTFAVVCVVALVMVGYCFTVFMNAITREPVDEPNDGEAMFPEKSLLDDDF